MKFFRLALIIMAFSPFVANARLFMEVYLTHRKGIDQGLTLMSELQSLEEFWGEEKISVELRNGIRLEVGGRFLVASSSEESFGPPSRVLLSGRLLGPRQQVWLDFTKKQVEVNLGEEFRTTYDDEAGQQVEIRLHPYL